MAKRGFVTLVSLIWSLWESVLGSTIAYLKLTKLTKVTTVVYWGPLKAEDWAIERPGHEKPPLMGDGVERVGGSYFTPAG